MSTFVVFVDKKINLIRIPPVNYTPLLRKILIFLVFHGFIIFFGILVVAESKKHPVLLTFSFHDFSLSRGGSA